MEAKRKVLLSVVFLVIIAAGFYLFTRWVTDTTGFNIREDDKTTLAQCLSGKSIVLYVNESCDLCLEQLTKFGSAIRFLNIVNCDNNKECLNINVPAWKINNEIKEGIYSLDELSN